MGASKKKSTRLTKSLNKHSLLTFMKLFPNLNYAAYEKTVKEIRSKGKATRMTEEQAEKFFEDNDIKGDVLDAMLKQHRALTESATPDLQMKRVKKEKGMQMPTSVMPMKRRGNAVPASVMPSFKAPKGDATQDPLAELAVALKGVIPLGDVTPSRDPLNPVPPPMQVHVRTNTGLSFHVLTRLVVDQQLVRSAASDSNAPVSYRSKTLGELKYQLQQLAQMSKEDKEAYVQSAARQKGELSVVSSPQSVAETFMVRPPTPLDYSVLPLDEVLAVYKDSATPTERTQPRSSKCTAKFTDVRPADWQFKQGGMIGGQRVNDATPLLDAIMMICKKMSKNEASLADCLVQVSWDGLSDLMFKRRMAEFSKSPLCDLMDYGASSDIGIFQPIPNKDDVPFRYAHVNIVDMVSEATATDLMMTIPVSATFYTLTKAIKDKYGGVDVDVAFNIGNNTVEPSANMYKTVVELLNGGVAKKSSGLAQIPTLTIVVAMTPEQQKRTPDGMTGTAGVATPKTFKNWLIVGGEGDSARAFSELEQRISYRQADASELYPARVTLAQVKDGRFSVLNAKSSGKMQIGRSVKVRQFKEGLEDILSNFRQQKRQPKVLNVLSTTDGKTYQKAREDQRVLYDFLSETQQQPFHIVVTVEGVSEERIRGEEPPAQSSSLGECPVRMAPELFKQVYLSNFIPQPESQFMNFSAETIENDLQMDVNTKGQVKMKNCTSSTECYDKPLSTTFEKAIREKVMENTVSGNSSIGVFDYTGDTKSQIVAYLQISDNAPVRPFVLQNLEQDNVSSDVTSRFTKNAILVQVQLLVKYLGCLDAQNGNTDGLNNRLLQDLFLNGLTPKAQGSTNTIMDTAALEKRLYIVDVNNPKVENVDDYLRENDVVWEKLKQASEKSGQKAAWMPENTKALLFVVQPSKELMKRQLERSAQGEFALIESAYSKAVKIFQHQNMNASDKQMINVYLNELCGTPEDPEFQRGLQSAVNELSTFRELIGSLIDSSNPQVLRNLGKCLNLFNIYVNNARPVTSARGGWLSSSLKGFITTATSENVKTVAPLALAGATYATLTTLGLSVAAPAVGTAAALGALSGGVGAYRAEGGSWDKALRGAISGGGYGATTAMALGALPQIVDRASQWYYTPAPGSTMRVGNQGYSLAQDLGLGQSPAPGSTMRVGNQGYSLAQDLGLGQSPANLGRVAKDVGSQVALVPGQGAIDLSQTPASFGYPLWGRTGEVLKDLGGQVALVPGQGPVDLLRTGAPSAARAVSEVNKTSAQQIAELIRREGFSRFANA